MGFFKDFKDDFSQAVNELMPGEDNLEDGAANEDLVVNTLENEVDVESELSKLDGLLEQVTSQTAKQQNSVQNQPVPSAPQPQPAGETKIEQPVIPENHVKNTQEERKMAVPYNHKAIEKKWKEKWAENPVNPKVDENGNPKKKYYCLLILVIMLLSHCHQFLFENIRKDSCPTLLMLQKLLNR